MARGTGVFLCGLVLLMTPAHAETYFVDPMAADGGQGTQTAPWPSINSALLSGVLRGGDRVVLATGEYGEVRLTGARFQSPVEFSANPGDAAHFTGIEIENSQNIHFRHIQVWPERLMQDDPSLVIVNSDSPDIEFSDVDLRSTRDAQDYRIWDPDLWLRYQVSGFLMLGPRNAVRDSTVTGIRFGIAITGDGSEITNNRVEGFSGDALRVLGNDSKLIGNHVSNCVKVDGNHDDGIQGWTAGPDGTIDGGVIFNLQIEDNVINEWVGNTTHPFVCDLQGIWLTRSMQGLIIRNNAVSVSAYHGISVGGASQTLIVNNTVVNSRAPSAKAPWIGIFQPNDPASVIVANNVAAVFNVNGGVDFQSSGRANFAVVDPSQQLRAPFSGDLRPAPGSQLINAGNATFAPPADLDGTPRTLGGAPDVGAYEVE